MSKYYTLEEVRAVRDEISKLGERSFPKLEAEWEKARAEWETRAEWSRAGAKWNKTRAEWDKAKAEWDMKLFDILIPILPEAHYRDWQGYLAIPKNKEEDWIVPVFTGKYKDIEHTAFSIWEMPKEDCDEKLAREVEDDAEKHR